MVRSQVDQGYQAFIIYPLVEETEPGERNDQEAGRSAVEEHARLQKEVFPKYRLGLLHGRMKPDEKDAVMAEFRDGKLNVLVSTSVVEVGVDIPNATMMIIEGPTVWAGAAAPVPRTGGAQHGRSRTASSSGNPRRCRKRPPDGDDPDYRRLQAGRARSRPARARVISWHTPGRFLRAAHGSLTDVRLIEKPAATPRSCSSGERSPAARACSSCFSPQPVLGY